MFFPIRTDRSLSRTPWVNYSLIAVNVLIFLATAQGFDPRYLLNPASPQIEQFVSYQFLHAGWDHLLGNMLFLYVFGNSVEDRLGKIAYLLFYLAGGILAGLGHAVIEGTTPVLGASGAVAAVSGAYLALFPMSNVTIVYWFIFIGTFEVSSMLLILFQIAQDAVFYVARFGGVAYLAHLSGYAYGFAIGMGLLWIRLLPREHYDLLALIEQRRRRAQFRALTRRGYQPWQHAPALGGSSKQASTPDRDPEHGRILELRSDIHQAMRDHQLDVAANLYLELMQIDSGQVLSTHHQLDLANQLMSNRHYDTAAAAYELFLSTYKNYGQREQIELILGLIYGRYLNRHDRAKELLENALPRLSDAQEKDLAKKILSELPR